MRHIVRARAVLLFGALFVGIMLQTTGCLSYVVAGFMPSYEDASSKWGAPGPGEGRIVMMTRVDHSGRIISGTPVFHFTLNGRSCMMRDGAFIYTDRPVGVYTFSNAATSVEISVDEAETAYVVIDPAGAAQQIDESAALEILEGIKFHPPESTEHDETGRAKDYCGDYWD